MDPAIVRALKLCEEAAPGSLERASRLMTNVQRCEQASFTQDVTYARALRQLCGNNEQTLADPGRTILFASKAIAVLTALNETDPSLVAELALCEYFSGRGLQNSGRPGESMCDYKSALHRFDSIGASETGPALSCLVNLGQLLVAIGNQSGEAYDMCRLFEARALAAPDGDVVYDTGLSHSARLSGVALCSLGRYEEALVCFRRSKQRYTKAGSEWSVPSAKCSVHLGGVLRVLGDLAGANKELRIAE